MNNKQIFHGRRQPSWAFTDPLREGRTEEVRGSVGVALSTIGLTVLDNFVPTMAATRRSARRMGSNENEPRKPSPKKRNDSPNSSYCSVW
eukprot:scaffold39823_cov145-Amphora_coffeaeformis.AAC.2